MSVKPHLLVFDQINEARGDLTFIEELKNVPFEVKRVYWLTAIPEQQTRGGHAHKTGQQVIVAISGIVEVVLESESGVMLSFTLDGPEKGLFIPAKWWGRMLFKGNALLLGLASDEFSESDYIRDRNEFDGKA